MKLLVQNRYKVYYLEAVIATRLIGIKVVNHLYTHLNQMYPASRVPKVYCPNIYVYFA